MQTAELPKLMQGMFLLNTCDTLQVWWAATFILAIARNGYNLWAVGLTGAAVILSTCFSTSIWIIDGLLPRPDGFCMKSHKIPSSVLS